MKEQWQGFKSGIWCKKIDVSDFIQKNYIPYDGDESFLEKKTSKTDKVWKKCSELLRQEVKKHVLDIDTVGGSYGTTRKCTMMISIKKEEKQITLKVIKARNKEIMTKDQGVTYIVDLDKGIWHYDNSTVIETTTKENFSSNNSIFRKKQTITNNIEDLI